MKFTKRMIEAVEAQEKRQTFFDDAFPGLALLVEKSGKKTFYYTYRMGKGRSAAKKWLMLGTFPVMSVEQAHEKAKDTAAKVRNGIDPTKEVQEQKDALVTKDALQQFCEEHFLTIKPATARTIKLCIKKHIFKVFGKIYVKDIAYSDIAKLYHAMKETPAMANRCLSIISTFLTWCERHGYRERKTNPCSDIKKYRENRRMEFLSATELAILGSTLDRMEQTWRDRQLRNSVRNSKISKNVDSMTPYSAAAIRLLMLTGARVGEILSLEWNFIDFERGVARLPDSKTGFKVLQLPTPALVILNELPRLNKWIFPSSVDLPGWPRNQQALSKTGHMSSLHGQWHALLRQSGLTGWRIHDLRHAFASMMVNSGASLPIIGKILGHTQASTTQRYAHLEQNPARKAAEDAAAKIAQAWASKPQEGKVIEFPKAQ